jgi:superfamily II DNA or RNA helicase
MGNSCLKNVPIESSTNLLGNKPRINFYKACLENSVNYKRATGYFRSSLLFAVEVALSTFLENGGKCQLVCSPDLTAKDIEAIEDGFKLQQIIADSLERDIFLSQNNVQDMSATKMLSYLIGNGILEIKIATKLNSESGIFHSKVGIFEDSCKDKIAFIGSPNETWSGWSEGGNHEAFIAFQNFTSPENQENLLNLENYFDKLWNDEVEGLVVRDFPDVPKQLLIAQSSGFTLEEIVKEVEEAAHFRNKEIRIKKSNEALNLMPHQNSVLENWKKNNYKGIITHVTGAGKTRTAISAIKDWILDKKPALVIVPSKLLQNQWVAELKKFIDVEPLLVGGDIGQKNNWNSALADETRNDQSFGSRIVIAILNSACSPDFLKKIQTGSHLLVVGDEVHTLGQKNATQLLAKLSETGGQLGLSATYTRFGDQEGTERIENVFGSALLPEFTISDAIASGRLTPYFYNFYEIALEELELENYEKLTSQINQGIAREGGSDFSSLSPYLKMLIFKRADILKKANAKIFLSLRVLNEHYSLGDRWLIYCDDLDQLSQVRDLLKDNGFQPLEYHTSMLGDRSSVLDLFSENGGILLAIKCLDEGVDIPSATHALILASSQNPREYIQRRGRVLRESKSTGKTRAYIFDTIVTDLSGVPVNKSEISRMKEFSKDCLNHAIEISIEELLSRLVIKDFEDEISEYYEAEETGSTNE